MRPQLFRTRITELFGIRHPILCGGLIWLADAAYVAAAVGGVPRRMGCNSPLLSYPEGPSAFVPNCANAGRSPTANHSA